MKQRGIDDRRSRFRLRYPQFERPTINIDGRDCQVVEISEGGCRIVLAGAAEAPFNAPISGEICFADGLAVTVTGVVLRSGDAELVMQLRDGITQKHMMAEQIRLRNKYPAIFSKANSQR